MLLWTLFACDTEEPVYEDFSLGVSTIEEVEEVPEEEVIDTEEPPLENRTITFKSIGISCIDLSTRKLTFTEMFPGRADKKTLSAELYAEAFRSPVADLSLETPLDENQQPEENNCLISMELPEVDEADDGSGISLSFREITLFGDNQDVAGVQWAFLYPAMFSKQQVNCTPRSVPVTGNKVTCENTISVGTTGTPSRNEFDPQLDNNDFYEWGSSVLLVYVKGVVTGSFADLGYEAGWNLVRLEQAELSLVEPINHLNEMQEIIVDPSKLQARDHIDALGSPEDTTWPEINYSIGLAPFRWFEAQQSSEASNSYEDSIVEINNSWILDVYSVPETSYFLTEDDAVGTYQTYYDQWQAYVPVAPFVPYLFDAREDDLLDFEDEALGALCKNSYMLAFLYFQRPSRPSETLWYQLMDMKPGWHVYLGSHGDSNTWRTVLENTTIGIEYNYNNLLIGESCQLPDSW